MSIPALAIFAVLYGPRVRREVTGRDVLAAHLDWVRRTGGLRSRGREGEDVPDDAEPVMEAEPVPEGLFELEEDGESLPLEPAKAFIRVVAAASELRQAWEADVLASVPSQLMFGLCGVADWAVYLSAHGDEPRGKPRRGTDARGEAATDLALRFEAVRDLLMEHLAAQGGHPLSEDELGRAVGRLEELVHAVGERAHEMLSPEEDADGARLVWFAFAQSGCPYTPASEFPRSSAWVEVPRAKAEAEDVAWWPDLVAICIEREEGAELLAPGRPRLAAEEQRRGTARFFRLRRDRQGARPTEPGA